MCVVINSVIMCIK